MPSEAKRRQVIIAVGLLAAAVFGPGCYYWGRLALERHRLDRQLAHLDREEQRLTQEYDRLQHDPSYVEGLIRSTFKVAKPGEIVISLDERRRGR